MRTMTEKNSKRPEWVPEEGGKGFASSVLKGVAGGHDGMVLPDASGAAASPVSRKTLTVEDYFDGVMSNDRSVMAPLVESNAERHFE
jgi:LAO/AO transport system kinase